MKCVGVISTGTFQMAVVKRPVRLLYWRARMPSVSTKVTNMKWLNITAVAIMGSLVSYPVFAVNNLSIPNEPLTVLSSRVDPNVMLLIDNSGSMNAAIWHED